MSKEVFEGVFMIPYQGQLRFRVTKDYDELVFSNPDHKYDMYFGGRSIVVYDYNAEVEERSVKQMEKRREFLHVHNSEIDEFIMGKDPMMEIEPLFEGKFYGEDFSANGKMTIYRLYE